MDINAIPVAAIDRIEILTDGASAIYGSEAVAGVVNIVTLQNREAGSVLTDWVDSVDYQEGVAAYLAGDHETGLALMSKAADDGYWIRPPGAFQESMYQDPGFVPLLEQQKVRQAREREKLLEVVCTDHPYAEVWQPSEETCEQYLSAAPG